MMTTGGTQAIVPYRKTDDEQTSFKINFPKLPIEIQQQIPQQWRLEESGLQKVGRFARTSKNNHALISKHPIWKSFAQQLVPHALDLIPHNDKTDYRSIVKNNLWILSEKELKCLSIIEANLRVQAANGFVKNFRNAYKCMQTGKPENFTLITQVSKNFLTTGEFNALDFLVNCWHEKGTATRIISLFKKSKVIYNYKSGFSRDRAALPLQILGPEIAQELEKLIKQTQHKIEATHSKKIIDKIKQKQLLVSPSPQKLIARVKKPRSLSLPPSLEQNNELF